MHTLQAVFPIYGPGARALLAGGTLAVFVLANAVLQAVLNRAMRGREVHAGLRVLARQGLRVALWLIGLASALGTLGINVSALIAGLGLGGFALGLPLRDLYRLAKLLLILGHPDAAPAAPGGRGGGPVGGLGLFLLALSQLPFASAVGRHSGPSGSSGGGESPAAVTAGPSVAGMGSTLGRS